VNSEQDTSIIQEEPLMRTLKRFIDLMGSWWPSVAIALLLGVVLYQKWEATHPG
jgi:hypothetical protein